MSKWWLLTSVWSTLTVIDRGSRVRTEHTHCKRRSEGMMAPGEARLPEVVASCRQNDAVRGKALVLHQEGDVTVELSRHQRAELLREQRRVIDLRFGAAAAAAAHRRCRTRTLRSRMTPRIYFKRAAVWRCPFSGAAPTMCSWPGCWCLSRAARSGGWGSENR